MLQVLTTVELGRLLRDKDIDFESLPDGEYDSILGTSSGAGQLFGTTGARAVAALRPDAACWALTST